MIWNQKQALDLMGYPQSIKMLLYNSMIVSHINYCILACGYEHKRLNKFKKRQSGLLVSVNKMYTLNHCSKH